MKNTYFRFKQFNVEQDACAMKVSTDGCILGAWMPVTNGAKSLLDIGTGTGLLALMMAQRFPALQIDAIELDAAAAVQAASNIAGSPFKDRINILEGDARVFQFPTAYDAIICNPPFFRNDLLGPEDKRNQARHGITLSLEDLFAVIETNLTSGGSAGILLPATRQKDWEAIVLGNGWQMTNRLLIGHAPGGAVNRVCSVCSERAILQSKDEVLAIKDSQNQPWPGFKNLLRDFYLDF